MLLKSKLFLNNLKLLSCNKLQIIDNLHQNSVTKVIIRQQSTIQTSVDLKSPRRTIPSSLNSDNDFVENSNLNTDIEWKTALPYDKIPGPSSLNFILSFLPGGKYYNKSLIQINELWRKEYGDIIKIPGTFGKRDIIITFSPENFRKVFRTEGVWPIRRGLDSITYYRKIARPEFFENAGGLVAEQGEGWSHFRTIVNPVMMQPKTIKLYVPSIDGVVNDFIERIKNIRNANTLEVPGNFEEEINNWTLESVGVVALDTRLGLIENKNNPKAKKLIAALKDFFQLVYELDFKPSMWKYITTPKFSKYINTLDTMTTTISEYIDDAQKRLQNKDKINYDLEQSVLQKLLKVDLKIARVMAMDMMMAGVDTTSSAFVSCLFQLAKNPDKQEILRQEIRNILPDKNTPLNANKIKNLPYLRACIKESLRIFPVTIGNFRTTGQNVVLSGYQIPKGVDVSMNSLVLQMDDKYYPNAKKFIPERWLRQLEPHQQEEMKKTECPSARDTDPFIFLPFGFGPRMCIGKRFVELELECALTKIVRNFIVEWNHPDLKFKSNVINLPDGELKFKFIDIEN